MTRIAKCLALALLLPTAAALAQVTPATPARTAASAPAASARPVIESAWARATPPGVDVGAVYFVVRNPGPRPDEVIGVRSAASARAEIHETRMRDGIMQMRQVTEATVPAAGTLAFEPGGTHVMLIGLRSPLVPGATVPLVVTFRQGGEMTARATVHALGEDPPSP
jgi:copper(I)-binding protein